MTLFHDDCWGVWNVWPWRVRFKAEPAHISFYMQDYMFAFHSLHLHFPLHLWLLMYGSFKYVTHKSVSHPSSWLEVWVQSHCLCHLSSSGPAQSTLAPQKHPFPSASLWLMASCAGWFWKHNRRVGKFSFSKKELWMRLVKQRTCEVCMLCIYYIHFTATSILQVNKVNEVQTALLWTPTPKKQKHKPVLKTSALLMTK